jgi:hypothetical protein
MKKIFTLFLFIFLIITRSHCQIPTSFNNINHNNVNATLSDGGIYFNNAATSSSGYEIPKGNNTHAIFSSGFWYGGIDINSQVKLSAQLYTPNVDIFPGPYSTGSYYNSSTYIEKYSPSIWKVSRAEIDLHIANYMQVGYVTPSSIAKWPGNGDVSIGVSSKLAPFIDLDNDGLYEPELGDYPKIKGCEAVYIIINDAARIHTGSNGEPIGIEVHLMFYQYASNNYLNNTTFVSKKIIHKGTSPLSDFSTTLFMDSDLGNYSDDFVGCDSTRNLMYTFNSDNNDENIDQKIGFGINPPVIGVVSLNKDLNNIGYYSSTNIYPYSEPSTPSQFYQYMHGNWANGSDMVQGGLGYFGSPGATSIYSPFMFSGDPNEPAGPNNWSELSNNNLPGDRRNFMSINSGNFNPGDTINIDYAILIAQGGNNIENIKVLKEISDSVKMFNNNNLNLCDLTAAVNLNELEIEKYEFKISPNPFNESFIIKSNTINSVTDIEIHDVSGRIVFSKSYQNTQSIEINLKENSGLYFVKLKDKTGIHNLKLVKE